MGGREFILNKCKQTNNLRRKIIQFIYKCVWIISEQLELTFGKQIKQLYYMSHLSLVISPTQNDLIYDKV